jgi:hypothetical protein
VEGRDESVEPLRGAETGAKEAKTANVAEVEGRGYGGIVSAANRV